MRDIKFDSVETEISNLTTEITLLKAITQDIDKIVLNRIIKRLETKLMIAEYELKREQGRKTKEYERGLRR